MKNHTQSGVTLVELMIVVVIIAVIASIAYPSYTSHIQETRRAEGASYLLVVAAAQERFFTRNNFYASAMVDLGMSSTSENDYYTVTIADNSANTSLYTLTATPDQTDAECENLTLSNTGARGRSANGDDALSVAECWR